jgi:peroxiredoxin
MKRQPPRPTRLARAGVVEIEPSRKFGHATGGAVPRGPGARIELVKPWAWLRRHAGSVALNVLVLFAIWGLIGAYQTRRHVAHDGTPAPDFELRDLSGQSVSLSGLRGRKVVLHFFATWCGVCRAELPSVRSLHANLESDEALLAIAEDSDDVEALRAFALTHELEYPILLGTREVLRAYAVGAFPTNYYLNADGTVSSSTVGLSTRLGMALRLIVAD